jgi:hypothetical protein
LEGIIQSLIRSFPHSQEGNIIQVEEAFQSDYTEAFLKIMNEEFELDVSITPEEAIGANLTALDYAALDWLIAEPGEEEPEPVVIDKKQIVTDIPRGRG